MEDKADLTKLDDDELFFGVGSSRPRRGDLGDLLSKRSESQLKAEQDKFDAYVKEMRRRRLESHFPYWIPGFD